MSKFVFVGDPSDNYSGANQLKVKGVIFLKNVPKAVPENLEGFFSQHSHFATPEAAAKIFEANEADTSAADALADAPDFVDDEDAMMAFTVKDLRAMCVRDEVEFSRGDNKAELVEKLIAAMGEPTLVDENAYE